MSMIGHDFDALWDFSRPAETERSFRALLDRSIGSADASYIAELRTQIARTCSLQGRFDEAHAILDAVEGSLESCSAERMESDAATARVGIRLRLERGRSFNSSGDPKHAMPQFEQAWTLAQAAGEDALAIDAAHMLAIVSGAADAGDREASRRWNERALALAEQSASPRARRWRASIHNNIGWSQHDSGDVEAALKSFERALELRIEQGDTVEVRIARWCVARCLRSLGRAHDALRMQQTILSECNATDEVHAGYVHEEIGECLLLLEGRAQAQPHFALAYRALHSQLQLGAARLDRMAQLGSAESATDERR